MIAPVTNPLPRSLIAKMQAEGILKLQELRLAILSVCQTAIWDARDKGDWAVVTPTTLPLPKGTKGRNLLTVRPQKRSFSLVILNQGAGRDTQFRAYNSQRITEYKRRMREVVQDIAPSDEARDTRIPPLSKRVAPSSSKRKPIERVRILPMSTAHSDHVEIEQQQNDYFLGALSGKLKGTYFCSSVLKAEPGTAVLFQYRGHIIASAEFMGSTKRTRANRHGYKCEMYFNPSSICVFQPVAAEQMRSIWTGEFKVFSQATKSLSRGPLDRFRNLIDQSVRIPENIVGSNRSSPGGWMASNKQYVRKGSDAVEVSADHVKMQHRLVAELESEYGKKNVITEQERVDVRVITPTQEILFEIKTDPTPERVIRNAIGQLLEYAYLNPQPKGHRPVSLVIVGPTKLGTREASYIERLKREFKIPLSYRVTPL